LAEKEETLVRAKVKTVDQYLRIRTHRISIPNHLLRSEPAYVPISLFSFSILFILYNFRC
jgi:hypothetical protein